MINSVFEKLVEIMARLRGPGGCPWDIEQNHESLKPYLLEETYEVLEAMDSENPEDLKEELGDLLLQIVFHAQISAEDGDFTIEDVLKSINEKLIRRHPHVYGNKKIKNAEEQTRHWERIKKMEGKQSVLDGVPHTFPSLLRARRIQQKAASVGFDWKEEKDVWKKIDEETAELKTAIESKQPDLIEEEMGDLLFSLVNLSRFLNVNPEESLRKAVNKFIERFHKVEHQLAQQGKEFEETSLDEMDAIWNRIKRMD